MDELVKDEAKLHISNGIEKASGAQGVDIKVGQKAHIFLLSLNDHLLKLLSIVLGCMQNCQRTNGQTVWALIPLRDG